MEQHVLGQGATGGSIGREARGRRKGGGIEVSPDTVRGLSIKHGGSRTRYFGPASPRVLLNLVSAFIGKEASGGEV